MGGRHPYLPYLMAMRLMRTRRSCSIDGTDARGDAARCDADLGVILRDAKWAPGALRPDDAMYMPPALSRVTWERSL